MQLHFCEGSGITVVLIFSSPVDAVAPDTFPPLHFISTGHHSSLLISGTNDVQKKASHSLVAEVWNFGALYSFWRLDTICGRHEVVSLHHSHCMFHRPLVLYHSTDGNSSNEWLAVPVLVSARAAFLPHACMHLLSHSSCCSKYLLLKSEIVFCKPRAGNPSNALVFGLAISSIIFPVLPFSLYILGSLQSRVIFLLYTDEKLDVLHLVAREARSGDFFKLLFYFCIRIRGQLGISRTFCGIFVRSLVRAVWAPSCRAWAQVQNWALIMGSINSPQHGRWWTLARGHPIQEQKGMRLAGQLETSYSMHLRGPSRKPGCRPALLWCHWGRDWWAQAELEMGFWAMGRGVGRPKVGLGRASKAC